MPVSSPNSTHSAAIARGDSSFSAVLTGTSTLPGDAGGQSGQVVQTAHEAVNAALVAADHFATGERHSVNLQFTVSGVDLAVRVDLRGDGIHTVFRTDSPELRVALEREWQSMTGASGERSPRLADPVFTSVPSTSGSSQHFDSSATADQRGSGARQEPQAETFAGIRVPRPSQPAPVAVAVPTAAAVLPTVRSLHAFA